MRRRAVRSRTPPHSSRSVKGRVILLPSSGDNEFWEFSAINLPVSLHGEIKICIMISGKTEAEGCHSGIFTRRYNYFVVCVSVFFFFPIQGAKIDGEHYFPLLPHSERCPRAHSATTVFFSHQQAPKESQSPNALLHSTLFSYQLWQHYM